MALKIPSEVVSPEFLCELLLRLRSHPSIQRSVFRRVKPVKFIDGITSISKIVARISPSLEDVSLEENEECEFIRSFRIAHVMHAVTQCDVHAVIDCFRACIEEFTACGRREDVHNLCAALKQLYFIHIVEFCRDAGLEPGRTSAPVRRVAVLQQHHHRHRRRSHSV